VWAIPSILPAGGTLFGGREKMGKSWLAFGLCIAVATGGYALGKMPVEQGHALYLSLEDPERRLHKRIRRLASDDTDLSHFHYATEWNPADRDGVKHLDIWLEENEGCRLLVIDTLKRIRPRTSGRRSPYEEDYEAVQPFVTLAAKHNAAIVVLHHLNQQAEPHDPFDAFSGSAGLTAAADGIWLLTRKRGDADAYLMVDGKDIEEPQELALGWDATTCSWAAQGDAATYRLNKERREIIELLIREDEAMGPKAVAELLGKGYDATKQMMKRMSDDGQLKQEGYGKYVPSSLGGSHSSHPGHSSTHGSGVTGVTPPVSADETNERVQRLIDQGVSEKWAIAEVLGREL
jgi:AAA domain